MLSLIDDGMQLIAKGRPASIPGGALADLLAWAW
jgi:hypothetical protein